MPKLASPLQHAGENGDTQRPTKQSKTYSIRDLTLPPTLARDCLWTTGLSNLQLEFVVDNQALAHIANGIGKISNDLYRAPLDWIRKHLLTICQHGFEYKSAFLDPVDWRHREFNTAADRVANCVLSRQGDVDTLDDAIVLECMRSAIGLQVFSDGGLAQGLGAAAFVVTAVHHVNSSFEYSVLGARGILLRNARSAFQAEVLALDIAIEYISKLT